MDELSITKSIIRSMLISEPTQQMTVREIARRHKEDEGKPIPYIKLGFDSVEAFLKSIPDTARFSGYGDTAYLQPVINKQVSHIQSMILRQRPPKSRSRRYTAPRTGNRTRNFTSNFGQNERLVQPRASPSENLSNLPSNSDQNHHGNSGSASACHSQAEKREEVYLPPTLQQKLLQLVQDDPGQSIQKFKSQVGYFFPYIAGILPNIEDLIHVLKTLHIVGGCVHFKNEEASGDSDWAAEKSFYPGDASLKTFIPGGMEVESEEDELFGDFNDSLCAKDNPLAQRDSKGCINHDLKIKLVNLLDHYSEGIWCSILPDIFQKYYRIKLDCWESGFSSIVEMLQSSPDTFVCVRENNNWKVSNAKARRTNSTEPAVSDQVRANIKRLIVNYPNGIHIDAFADLYERLYLEKFDCKDMKFSRIDDLFMSINNKIVKMKREENSFIILPLEETDDQTVKKPEDVNKTLSVTAGVGMLYLIPSDCVRPDYKFPKLVLPEGVMPGSSLCLVIASVSNLDNFYVHIRGSGYSEALDNLADEMTVFYESNMQNYCLPSEAVVPGIYCVTVTFGEFSRCIVSAEESSEEVTVIPMDYGCTIRVKKKSMYYLHKDFAQLPPQAINCRCANLAPSLNEATFKRQAALRFLKLVKDKAVIAHVSQYDRERKFLSVSLTDTSGDEDVHINDLLCQEGLASFRMDTPITDIPTVQHCVKWEPPTEPKKEPRQVSLECMEVGTFEVEGSLQIKEEQQQPDDKPQQIEELQSVAEPKLPQQLKETMTPNRKLKHILPPPPGFNQLPFQNLSRKDAPFDSRLFPDLDQLIDIADLTKGEQVDQEMFHSPASLQESHNLQAGSAQQNVSAYAPQTGNSPGTTVKSDGPRTVCIEFSSLEQLKGLTPIVPPGYSTLDCRKQNPTTSQVGCDWGQAKCSSPKHYKPMIQAPFVRPNPLDSSFTLEQPRTVQVEYSSSEQLKSTNLNPMHTASQYESLPLPPNLQAAPTEAHLVQNHNFLYSNSNNKNAPLANYGMPNVRPQTQLRWTPNFALLQPPMYQVPFVNNGMAYLQHGILPSPLPLSHIFQSNGYGSTNVPNQPTMLSPNCWNREIPNSSQSYPRRPNIPLPPKKILEIRSPTTLKLQNIPHAAYLSDEVKKSLSTPNSVKVKSESSCSESKESVNSKNTSQLSLETDFSHGPGERPTFSRSTYPLNNDSIELDSIDQDSYTKDSLDEEDQEDTVKSGDFEASLDAANESNKVTKVEETCSGEKLDSKNGETKKEDGLMEFADSEVGPRSSTPLSSADLDMHGSLENDQNQVNFEDSAHSMKPAEHPDCKPKLTNAMDVKNVSACQQRRLITTICVAGKPVNVFWMENKPYFNVENLLSIGKLRAPVALKIIKTKSINKKLCEVKAKAHPEIFKEMAKLGICHANLPNAKLLLIKLYDVGELLSTINVSDTSYMKELHSQVFSCPIT